MKGDQKNYQEKIWFFIDILLILYLACYFLSEKFFSFQIMCSFTFLHNLILVFFIFRFVIRFLLIFLRKGRFKIINIFFTLIFIPFLIFLSIVGFGNLIFPTFVRDTYYFPDNSNERFTVYTYYSGSSANSYIHYERELVFGIKCSSMIDTYRELFSANEANSDKYLKYIKENKIDIDYNKYIYDIKNSENLGFCYQNLHYKYENDGRKLEYDKTYNLE